MNHKTGFFSAGLALALLLGAGAQAKANASTVTLRAEPEKNILLSGVGQDAMIKISIETSAAAKEQKSRVNLCIALDRSGSMHGYACSTEEQARN